MHTSTLLSFSILLLSSSIYLLGVKGDEPSCAPLARSPRVTVAGAGRVIEHGGESDAKMVVDPRPAQAAIARLAGGAINWDTLSLEEQQALAQKAKKSGMQKELWHTIIAQQKK